MKLKDEMMLTNESVQATHSGIDIPALEKAPLTKCVPTKQKSLASGSIEHDQDDEVLPSSIRNYAGLVTGGDELAGFSIIEGSSEVALFT